MKLLSIDLIGLGGWVALRGKAGTYYMDRDGFHKIAIVGMDNFDNAQCAVVMCNATPVLKVWPEDSSTGYDYEVLRPSDNDVQDFVSFMTLIGEADEDANAFAADHGLDAAYEAGHMDFAEGHLVLDFVDRVEEALRASE